MPTALRWPASLPQSLPLGTNEYGPDAVIRTQTDQGPMKARKRFTAQMTYVAPESTKFVFDLAQRDTMQDWYDNQTAGGALTFMWLDILPSYGDREVRFFNRPKFTSLLPDAPGFNAYFYCEVVFEVLP